MIGPADVIVVGGGAAGCVVASRLSEDVATRVLLLESGRDTAGHEPALVSRYPGRASAMPGNLWHDLTVSGGGFGANDSALRPRFAYAQARLLGGGTAINGVGANRGAPRDYEEWVEAGAEGWGWADVLPFFRRLECDLDLDVRPQIDSALHGRDGPLPIRRALDEDTSAFVAAAKRAALAAGMVERADQNGEWADGVYPITLAVDRAGRRVSAAEAYLSPQVRRRANLEIRTGVDVAAVVFDGTKAVGVRLANGTRLAARHVILCAGALATPALLMRSGVGPGASLQAMGLPIVAARRGVGRNLLEHPYAGVMARLPPESRLPADAHHIPLVVRFSSGLAGAPEGDMHMAVIGRAAWHAVGRRIGMLGVWVNKSWSTGEVRLASPDPQVRPLVDFRLLSDPRDAVRLASGFRFASRLLANMAATGVCGSPQPARMSDRARRFGAPTLRNSLVTRLFDLATRSLGPMGNQLFDRLTASGPSLDMLVGHDLALARHLQDTTIGVWHASGTARMGQRDDEAAVVTAQGHVIGVEGLSVCDASVFPTIPCANIAVPVMMVAEKMSDHWRRAGLSAQR